MEAGPGRTRWLGAQLIAEFLHRQDHCAISARPGSPPIHAQVSPSMVSGTRDGAAGAAEQEGSKLSSCRLRHWWPLALHSAGLGISGGPNQPAYEPSTVG